jgi:NosR/NirI family nitrous oxide reductase transcriptional regulator
MSRSTIPWVRLYRLAVVASIAWLIFKRDPSTPPTADFTLLFPDAADAKGEEVFDHNDRLTGYFLTTSPSSDHLKGYSGPTNVALALDRTGRVTELQIVHSTDTPDHLESVIQNRDFWKAHQGLNLGAPGTPKVDAVTGSTLTSQAISRAIIERLGGETTSRLFPTAILLAELPEATSLEDHPDWPGVKLMYDESRSLIGHALRTAPSLEYLHGYQGPTDVLIVLDADAEKVTRLRFRKSYDNEEYYERILDDDDYLQLYDGRSIDQILELDTLKIEGVSGATDTSWALAESVKRRLAQFESDRTPVPFKFPWRNAILILLTLGAAAFSFTSLRGNPLARLLWQLTVVLTLGIILGDLLSQALFMGWALHGLPFQDSYGLIFLAGAALLVPWASGSQLYCHHLCPHGFVQRWLGKLPIKTRRIPPLLHRLLSYLPSSLLLLIVATVITGASWNLASLEGFDAWLWRSAGSATIVIAIVGLVASIFSPLAYCKYGCPTGALFKFLRKTSGNKTLGWRDGLAGLLCLAAAFL